MKLNILTKPDPNRKKNTKKDSSKWIWDCREEKDLIGSSSLSRRKYWVSNNWEIWTYYNISNGFYILYKKYKMLFDFSSLEDAQTACKILHKAIIEVERKFI